MKLIILLNKEIEKNIDSKSIKDNYKKILTLFSPAIPHFHQNV